MINVNILNNLIGGISKQIPLVHSYYTTSPYESWNTKEIEYGSVSFVITKVNTRETTTTFDATIYYGDRLLEDCSNRDSIHSDAATVIQTIVGALNTSDDYLEVSYPVGITLFEQDFEDTIAGGWAQLSISAEGMGECFNNELEIPAIVGTSLYYTKDEINQLFPLKTELSTVAFTGSFNDLTDKPDVVSQQQYNDLYTAVKESTEALSEEMKQKINVGQYNAFTDEIKSYIEGVPSKQDFNNLTQAVIDSTSSLAGELDQKVNVDYFDTWADGIEADLATRPTGQNFDTLRQDLIDQIDVINKNVNDKVSSAYFESWKTQTESTLNSKASSQALNNLSNELNNTKNSLQQQIDEKVTEDEVKAILGDISSEELATKAELEALESEVETNARLTATALEGKVSVNTFNAFKETITAQTGNGVTKQEFDNLTEAVVQSTSSLAAELEKKVNVTYFDGWADGIESMIDNKVSQQSFDNAIANVYKKAETYSKSEIDRKLDNVVIEGDINLSNYYTKDEVDDIISTVEVSDTKLADYAKKTDVYTKTQTYSRAQIDAKLEDISNVDIDLSDYPTKAELEASYYTKSEVSSTYAKKTDVYTKSEIDDKLANIDVGDIDLSDYPTKAELEASYYTKSEIDDKLDEIGTGGTVDLSNYYNKSETYSKSEIDATIGNINTILNNVLYTL